MEGRAFLFIWHEFPLQGAGYPRVFSPARPQQKSALLGCRAKAARGRVNTQKTAIRHANIDDMLYIPGIIAGGRDA
jgi:hypothetical protein